jgi:GNAT superfamily N-acetyltransferase
MNSQVLIREAKLEDIPEIVRQRCAMYQDIGHHDPEILETVASLSDGYLAKALAEGSFRAWLASVDGRDVAGGGVLISPWPAHPYDLECRRATILNVFTDHPYRRQGIARQIMQTIVDWCRNEGFARVNLHASDVGRRLYESMGFEASNEMRLKLR